MTAGERAVYHGVQGGRVFASALIVKNPRVTRVVVEKSAFPLSSIQKHWGFRIQSGGLKITTLFSASIHASLAFAKPPATPSGTGILPVNHGRDAHATGGFARASTVNFLIN